MPRVPDDKKRPVVEGRTSIDVRRWQRDGLLRPGQIFHVSWSRGSEPAGGIEVLPTGDAVVLLFCWRRSDTEKWKPAEQRVTLTWTKCHLGGIRPWFRCTEDAGDGQCCGRRVAKLYLQGHVFACRKCCGLVYESQSESPLDRSIRRARNMRMRLGGGRSILDPFPEKPPRMHQTTYYRLFNKAAVAQEHSIALSRDYLRRHHPGVSRNDDVAER